MRATFAALMVAGALLIPASQAGAAQIASSGAGPVATKSGAIINYTSVKKLKVARHMFIHFTCAVTCDATGIATLKARGLKFPIKASGQGIPAASPAFMEITVKGALLKAMKASPGRFKVANTITATDPTTGAVDRIRHTFKFKR